MRTILVPTDFSEDAARAARQALRLLRPEGDRARLVLLHAYHVPVDLTLLGGAPMAAEQFTAVREAAKRELDTLAASLGGDLACAVEGRAEEGHPVDAILRTAQELDADLVAMGTHGRSGLEHLLLGSTAERVLPHAPCPVLTLRRPA